MWLVFDGGSIIECPTEDEAYEYCKENPWCFTLMLNVKKGGTDGKQKEDM